MFTFDSYLDNITGIFSRRFMFTAPYPTTRLRIDQLEGADRIAFKIELLGVDRKTMNKIVDPMMGGYITSCRKIM